MPRTVRYPLTLGLVCVVMGFGIGLSYQLMKDRIARKELEVTLQALDEVLPENTHQPWTVLEGRDPRDPDAVFVGLDDRGETTGYAALGEHQGYSSKVRVMVGVEPDLSDTDHIRIKAVRVVSQQETPGLGTRVEERRSSKTLWDVLTFSKKPEVLTRPFLDQFAGKTYGKVQVIKTDDGSGRIVAVTAATISSTAVVEAVRKAVLKIRRTVLGLGGGPDASTGATGKPDEDERERPAPHGHR